ncbi:phage portal protein [Nonomuraea typhae]|uniref:phage portal protein n=1 Tax=Nonomuraea typhae TaxID=2603600 RepID=UPI0012FA697F|nr:phage portal protein [Nonomuraea typhae]
MKLWRSLLGRDDEKRYSFSDWAADKMLFGGMTYPLLGGGWSKSEEIEQTFPGYVQGAYKANGVVFATVLARLLLFTEARFQWQRMSGGRPGDLFGTPDLAILETPWPNGTTGELLARMEQDASLGGNFYAARETGRIRRLRPDWVSIILTAPPDEAVESDVAGYLYRPGGIGSRAEGQIYLPDEVCHWSPVPDPEAQYRGMSWVTPVVREVQADKAATLHKSRFFDNAATPNLAVSFKESVTKEQFKEFMEAMNAAHQGVDNAYRTLYLGGGADVTVVGADLRQLDFKQTQGAGETRITAAGGVPAVIVGLSEGLQAATYSNYGQARRKFGDHWARPQWRSAAAALSVLLPAQGGGVRLWYDDANIAFLREDRKDIAEIQAMEAQTIRTLGDAGYEPDSVKAAVKANDWSLLVHSGLYSVQLQPAGTQPALPAA